VEHDAADELDVVVAQADRAFGSLADGGEGLYQDVVQGFPARQAAAELRRFGAQRVVAEGLVGPLQRVDALHDFLQPGDFPVIGVTEETAQKTHSILTE